MPIQAVLMQSAGSSFLWVLGVGGAVAALVFFAFAFRDLNLWIQSVTTRAGVGLVQLVTMRFRKVDARVIVGAKVQLVKSGIHEVSTDDLESHYLAGGRVTNVSHAMIAANRASLGLDWKKACAIDLAGRDIIEAIATSVNPKVINCPGDDSTSDKLDAVAKDGIRLLAKARVTVRTNIAQLIGGATEETVIARVGQSIVSAIGSCETYKDVLENPDKIAKSALRGGLAAGTAFEILSVDIADISVAGVERVANVGAELQKEQAIADSARYKAEAQKRQAMAIALAHENRAKIEENRALVVLAEAEVPKAMADAFRSGNLGIMDYYRMKNIQADTTMRDSIGGDQSDDKKSS